MPKVKTKKSAAKRLRVTGKGKIKRAKVGRRHLMSSKNSKRRLSLKKSGYVSHVDEKRAKALLPYA